MPKKNIIRNEVHQVIEVVKEDKKVDPKKVFEY